MNPLQQMFMTFCFYISVLSWSDVIVKLRNRGPDAFRSNEYGESIIVERRITAEGGGGYKLKSASGKYISASMIFKVPG